MVKSNNGIQFIWDEVLIGTNNNKVYRNYKVGNSNWTNSASLLLDWSQEKNLKQRFVKALHKLSQYNTANTKPEAF